MKRIEVVAGPNGSGKTTFAMAFFKMRNGKSRFINPDIIAAGLSAGGTEKAAFQAGRVMIRAIEDALGGGESFAFESTLSGRTWLPLLKRAVKMGYQITIYFVFLKNSNLNLKRIKKRVKEGGHSVPKKTVLRRYPRSFSNFWNIYRPLCENWYVFDNSSATAKQVMSKAQFTSVSGEEQNSFVKFFLTPSKR